ncbi:hypothetical protein [Nocardia sp. NPDC050406]|uniref:hypothetical protein n=1 Tax=Nocardia sp. NPDC050406 TaxID=3364318 RepID=UPI00379D8402
MALTAAGTGHSELAIVSGGVCAATLLFALLLLSTTVHRDHVEQHRGPNLLDDNWHTSPRWVRDRGTPEA